MPKGVIGESRFWRFSNVFQKGHSERHSIGPRIGLFGYSVLLVADAVANSFDETHDALMTLNQRVHSSILCTPTNKFN